MESSNTFKYIVEGLLLVGGTVVLQFLAQLVLESALRVRRSRQGARLSIGGHRIEGHPLMAVLILTVAMLLQGALWAALYYRWGELRSYGNAFYFSIASFSTVGASELVLSPGHRLVGALEAAMGMLMFGWSAALLVKVVQEDARHAASE